ncbi:YdgH/BhsA/McbA-like domain containing protein [Kluyvera sp. STS39-E]|uniref:YdgH/BhsA/McbA-like domain containing protein n=1 Tax=Enterobacteriaceae TaxID=543 RepID=UPI000E3C6DD5|nr:MULTISPECIES: YdgH/BhsA/McbA-like domain containing protein [Citrobacter]MBD0826607.1 DUF1471 domain-containing protein [Citrobacter sp. C1]RFU93329.1 DUF1471 domain-containing protein [Citrobacter gillenii]
MIKISMMVLMLSTVATNSFAANKVNNFEGSNRIGVVSASGATTLSELESKLSEKAVQAGGGSYKIISAGGANKLHGVALVYK